MTACSTFSPRYASASVLSFCKIIAEISSGVNVLPAAGMLTTAVPFFPSSTLYGTILRSEATSPKRRPMKRLIEYTVFSGLRIACRRAIWPTKRSPVLLNPTTEGVSRLPSAFGMTVGSPPIIAAITEFVVPRSIPTTFAMPVLLPAAPRAACRCRPAPGASRAPARVRLAVDLDLHRRRLHPLRLRHAELEEAVLVGRLGLRALYLGRERQRPRERPVPELAPIEVAALLLFPALRLTLQGDRVVGDGDIDRLRVDVRQLRPDDDAVLGFKHLHGWLPHDRPGRISHRLPRCEELVEHPLHRPPQRADFVERIPAHNAHRPRPPCLRVLLVSALPIARVSSGCLPCASVCGSPPSNTQVSSSW